MGQLIPQNIIDEILSKADIVNVVEDYVQLTEKSQANYFGLCPFHHETLPSFSVSPNKQIFYCFGCHKGGNSIQFIKEIEKCSYPEAIKFLAKKVQVSIPESDDVEWQKKQAKKKMIYEILLEAARYYYLNLSLAQGDICQKYLKKRGLRPDIIKKFGLGYAIDAWDGLLKHLKAKGYKDETLLIDSGLFHRRSGLYDSFRKRLMFPIFDAFGHIIAFGGRILTDELPKYINSPETLIYSKSRHLYGFNFAKKTKEKYIIVVEGYLDCVALYQIGFDNVCASLGTALTEQQANILKRFNCDEVIIAYDSDKAGERAALRGLDVLSAKSIAVRVLQVPEGKDPDDYARKHGKEHFKALVDNALPLLEFKLKLAERDATNAEVLDILKFQDEACRIIAEEPNAIVREMHSVKIAKKINASPNSVLKEIERRAILEKHDRDNSKDQLRKELKSRLDFTKQIAVEVDEILLRKELLLLILLADAQDLIKEMKEPLIKEDFSSAIMRSLYDEVMEAIAQDKYDLLWLNDATQKFQYKQQSLNQLLIEESMKIEMVEAKRKSIDIINAYHLEMKLAYIQHERDTLKQLLGTVDEAEQEEIRKRILMLTTLYNKKRQK